MKKKTAAVLLLIFAVILYLVLALLWPSFRDLRLLERERAFFSGGGEILLSVPFLPQVVGAVVTPVVFFSLLCFYGGYRTGKKDFKVGILFLLLTLLGVLFHRKAGGILAVRYGVDPFRLLCPYIFTAAALFSAARQSKGFQWLFAGLILFPAFALILQGRFLLSGALFSALLGMLWGWIFTKSADLLF